MTLAPGSSRDEPPLSPSKATGSSLAGVRPSPLDGRPTTSTGTSSLDQLLAGHAGLALGTSLLIEENGTSDYAGALLRYYGAEGLVQGHHILVVGVPEQWGRTLPGLSVSGGSVHTAQAEADKMKIAWRYERLGQTGGIAKSRGGQSLFNASIALDECKILVWRMLHVVPSLLMRLCRTHVRSRLGQTRSRRAFEHAGYILPHLRPDEAT